MGKPFDHTPIAGEIQLDAYLQGLGACFVNQVYANEILLGYKDFAITHLEMLNILVALRVWGQAWQGKKLLVHCDNKVVVVILNTGATRDLTLAAIARHIFMQSVKCDMNINGKKGVNSIAGCFPDGISQTMQTLS